MNVLDLLKELGGEILANKARVVVDGKIIIIGRLNDQTWEPTTEGEKLAGEVNSKKPPAKPTEPAAPQKAAPQKAAAPKASKQIK